MTELRELDALRVRGVRLLTLAGWVATALLAVIGATGWRPEAVAATIVASLSMVLPTWVCRGQRHDIQARLVLGMAAAVLPACFVYAFQDHPWQMDMHMFFFVALAALVVLADWRPIAVAAGLTAAHHLLFLALSPEWVFTGSGNLGRVFIHALAVSLQYGALHYFTNHFRRLIMGQADAQAESEKLATAEAARRQAEEALGKAERMEREATVDRRRREDSERNAAKDRQSQLLGVAERFEESVSLVVDTVSAAARKLEGSSRELNGIAGDTGRQASAVADTAAHASRSARTVAEAVASLSTSIGVIVEGVEQQAFLGKSVRAGARSSDEAVSALSELTGNIGGFVDVIGTIASRTNMLALNATIEAARAGEAGRSFAVVAGEVKGLAGQTRDATASISGLIAGVQQGATRAEASLGQVVAAFDEMLVAANTINVSIADQRAMTETIERNAAETAMGVDQTALLIGRVAQSAKAAGALSATVEGAATALSTSAARLQATTDEFVGHLRAA